MRRPISSERSFPPTAGWLRAQRRVEIDRAALERARSQLATNRKLVEGGRMAPQDLVQTEAEVADREYALVDSEYALEEARSTLVNVLDLEDDARPELEPEAAVVAERPELAASLETAFRATHGLAARRDRHGAGADRPAPRARTTGSGTFRWMPRHRVPAPATATAGAAR